jgi:ATP-binding protein involved in chromosome partitioning
MAKPDEAALRARLGEVRDPDLDEPLAALGLLDVERVGRRLVVRARVLPGSEEAADAVRLAIRERLEGTDAEIVIEPLDDAGAAALGERLESPAARASRAKREPAFSDPQSTTRILGVSSGKGGVGKSSVAVNLALALAGRGARTAIVDADVYGFSVPKMLGGVRPPRVAGELIVPPRIHGVRVISLGFFVDDDTPVIWRGPMLHSTLQQFLVDVAWGELDYLVVDMPPGTGDVALSLQEFLPRSEIYVVTTPQPAAQRVAQRSAIAARKLKLPVRGVIENMSAFVTEDGRRYEIFGVGGGDALAATLGVPVLGRIPLTMALRAGGDDGEPVVLSHPQDPAAQAIEELAARIVSLGAARRYRPGLRVQATP